MRLALRLLALLALALALLFARDAVQERRLRVLALGVEFCVFRFGRAVLLLSVVVFAFILLAAAHQVAQKPSALLVLLLRAAAAPLARRSRVVLRGVVTALGLDLGLGVLFAAAGNGRGDLVEEARVLLVLGGLGGGGVRRRGVDVLLLFVLLGGGVAAVLVLELVDEVHGVFACLFVWLRVRVWLCVSMDSSMAQDGAIGPLRSVYVLRSMRERTKKRKQTHTHTRHDPSLYIYLVKQSKKNCPQPTSYPTPRGPWPPAAPPRAPPPPIVSRPSPQAVTCRLPTYATGDSRDGSRISVPRTRDSGMWSCKSELKRACARRYEAGALRCTATVGGGDCRTVEGDDGDGDGDGEGEVREEKVHRLRLLRPLVDRSASKHNRSRV
ncbi:uncharacterized protein K452DRAFT_158892 [Aplosporella prunicola CBS 121167]|uniref:Uncharacterized protein n=1 Tax=Aplosporella prunicola CBS 121167 TaxID=1176127 RepID=A0A6A6AV25_9PEZI|nr:uncharacterized protein K452DRAFT_158892 [Aplosporella prunicola CBS 121167]KAF2135789.1 hypothetical protein K452DRAFT_158892 [Aplosporella prunicola CBS 121167]